MSNPSQLITLSTLKFLTPNTLVSYLQASTPTSTSTSQTTSTSPSDPSPSTPTSTPTISIIDVRDNDHIGGHIRTSTWIPTPQLDAHMPELLRTNASTDRVVFHCMLSQQRGPKAALTYARARAEKVRKERRENGDETKVVDEEGRIGGQEICVLQGGFEGWRLAGFAEDEKLTEGYVKDLWE